MKEGSIMTELSHILVHCDDCGKHVEVKDTWIVNNDTQHVVCDECSKKYTTKNK